MRNLSFVFSLCLLLSGCSVFDWKPTSDSDTAALTNTDAESLDANSIHRHVEKLARQLFNTSQPIDNSRTLAIGTILPTTGNSGASLPLQPALGLQIQESLITFATQVGLKVIEYKTMPAIKIGKQADSMLSRDITELNVNISADYFLTGTYTLQENSTVVNIRLIQVPENIVLAAATDYMPNNAMWSQSKVTLKNNQIYRSAY